MQLLFELSKEHPTLPHAEVLSCLSAEAPYCTVLEKNDNVLIVDAPVTEPPIQRLAERLALTTTIDQMLFSCPADLDAIAHAAEQHPLMTPGSMAIRCHNRSTTLHSPDLIDRLGGIYTPHRDVNLIAPDIELRAIVTQHTAYVGIKKAAVDTRQFHRRRGHLRPFLAPITLHPKLARALVNLSSIKTHGLLLDPFCGTGGILLEAGLIGARTIGSDIQQQMINGCRKTLEHYGITNHQLFCCDIGRISTCVPPVDAVVTDFPYGKATTTKGEHLQELYDRAFAAIASVVKPHGTVVVGLSEQSLGALGDPYLTRVDSHAFRVHRSLTRYFYVYRK
ncbi:MAG: methyltransferase domain-containing protein [Candidatus Thermoplasmatota archaeon]|nr:methyltransferase domain-containing protein [Candidatus Thermoplasmatota archaeon]